MTESPEYKALLGEDDYIQIEEPEDLDEDSYEDEHEKSDVGGPGGIINYPEETHPEGWQYIEGESSPPVEDI
jgi:hypothetical protein